MDMRQTRGFDWTLGMSSAENYSASRVVYNKTTGKNTSP